MCGHVCGMCVDMCMCVMGGNSDGTKEQGKATDLSITSQSSPPHLSANRRTLKPPTVLQSDLNRASTPYVKTSQKPGKISEVDKGRHQKLIREDIRS